MRGAIDTHKKYSLHFFIHILLSPQVKQALWDGGIVRSNRTDGKGSTPGLRRWEDLVRDKQFFDETAGLPCCPLSPIPPPNQTLIYAGQALDNDKRLADYGVPPVRVGEGVWQARRSASLSLSPSSLPPAQGCQALIAIETARLTAPHDADSPFWD